MLYFCAMILIADSGSTKTIWYLSPNPSPIGEGNKAVRFTTSGFNPFFWTTPDIVNEIKRKCPRNIIHHPSSIKHIFFYGSGCSSPARNKIISLALKKVFPKAKAEVRHDLMGAARALFGNEKGIACILGTGSNSCLYDGKEIIKRIGGIGYVLGDEGGGAHIGLALIKALLNDELPENIQKKFLKEYAISKSKIIESVYNKKHPNRFLAIFAKFIRTHIDNAFLRALVHNCFEQFVDKHICKYENHKQIPVGFVGSIAFHFKDILTETAKEKNIILNKIIKSPIDELVKYHLVHS